MQLSDEQVWESCLKGDKNGFKEIYSRHYLLMYNYGLKFVNDKEVVKDCIQDIFIKLINNKRNLAPTRNVKGYLLKTLRNRLVDQLETNRNMVDIALYEDIFATNDLGCSLSFDDAEQDLLAKHLMKVLSQLSSHHQEIIYLYYVKELKHDEIAEILEINYQSSKNLLFRALNKLRKLYTK